MKSILKYAGLCVLFICSLLIESDIANTTLRKEEMEEGLQLSMRNTLKSSTYSPMYEVSKQEMNAEFIRYLADNINTDGDFEVIIHHSDPTIGLLDVKLRTRFTHNNGQEGMRELRRTSLVEKFKK